ncbi:MAG TPA: EamA family transporter RarD [Rhizomicrobium sp.]|jgi:chloramphenicol-sensitive protein RarD|nr:EamA family transporter RarD [Rhizomicrobium sp.]
MKMMEEIAGRDVASGELAAAGETGAPLEGAEASLQKDDLAGVTYAALAYIFWGIVPIYWRWLADVPPFQITVHRVLWCAIFVAVVSFARGRILHLFALVRNPRILATLTLTSVLISINWLIYIYCVASDQLVEASLGYYIVPLLSIALGVAFYGEHLSRLRLFAVVLAGAAVILKTLDVGHIPWIAPALALSFGFYGYFRKRANVDAMDGLTIETLILFPVTLVLVLFWTLSGTGAFHGTTISTDALLIFGGPLTAVPLAMFASGARRIRLSTLGFLQYLAPSITLILAIFGFGEHFTRLDAVTFGCVWAALVIVALEGRLRR